MATIITLLVLCLPLITLSYIAVCAAKPWKPCQRCPSGRRRHACRPCDGTGLRPRLGWRLYVHFRRLHRDGTR